MATHTIKVTVNGTPHEASVEYKREMARVLTARALATAVARAEGR